MSLKSGHKIVALGGKEQQRQLDEFKGYGVGTIRLQPDGWFFTAPFIQFADKMYDFKFKPSDVLVMTYAKCGTTWMQEIIWTMRNNPDLNHPLASLPVNVRSPFMEFDFIMKGVNFPPVERGHAMYDMFCKRYPDKDPEGGMFLHMSEATPDPRTLKTHLAFSLFNPALLDTCKVVYVARDPKDVVVSYYHHSRLLKVHGYEGTLDTFVDFFINDELMYSPYWPHVKEAWEKRHHPNLHFIFYEDMKAKPKEEIIRLQSFLATTLTMDQIENVVEYTSFSVMKARETQDKDSSRVNATLNVDVLEKDGGFFRKGISGDWKNKLTEEQKNKIQEWTKKNVDKYFGSEFKYSFTK